MTDFPEEEKIVNNFEMKFYGETSYENQMAVLSHFLHNRHKKLTKKEQKEIIEAVREFLSRKEFRQKIDVDTLTDDDILFVAENPVQYNLFSQFFDVPFPAPEKPKFTFIDLFAGIGGFRIAMQAQGGKCVFSSEWNSYAQQTYFANFGEMPFGDITKEVTKKYIPKKFDIISEKI